MASSFDTIMGSLFSVVVVAGVIAMSFYGALSPTLVGVAIIAFLVIWYLSRGADVDPPSGFSRNNTTPSSTPSGGDGPDMDGPSLDDSSSSDGPGGPSGGGGPEDPVLINFNIQTRGNIALEEGISTSDIFLEFAIKDRSGTGLKELDINFPIASPFTENLDGKPKKQIAIPLDQVVGDTKLSKGDYPFEVRIVDNDGNETNFSDSFPVSNKNGGGKGTSMPPGSIDWEKFHSEAQKEEQQFQKAIKELGQYKNDLDEEEETVQYLLNEAKDILKKIHNLDEEFVKIESGSIGRKKTESQIDQMKVEIQEINKELKDFQAKLAHEVEVESNDEKLLNQIQELEEGLENEINYMNKQLNNL